MENLKHYKTKNEENYDKKLGKEKEKETMEDRRKYLKCGSEVKKRLESKYS